mmetsp:Transcript_15174/g.32423  ORF Transcript_15174/g.32423 Transcript_15174/m.32423 type:complete len:178 (-) Transcript_15174:1367-1900(-)
MLAAELAKHKEKSTTSTTSPVSAEVGPTSACPGSGAFFTVPGHLPVVPTNQISQSLPSGNQLSLLAKGQPPKPRVRPSPAPSFSAVPILELPEPSLGESYGDTTGFLEDDGDTAAPDVEESGGTSLFENAPPPQVSFQYAASAPASMLWGAHAHKHGMSSMGGRTPSRTMLDALQHR